MLKSIFICYPRALLTSITLPMEMLTAANSVARIKRTAKRNWQSYLVAGLTPAGQAIEFAKGMSILPSYDLDNAPVPDKIFLPPIWGNPDVVIERSSKLINWIVEQHKRGAEICATGTGVCLLAHAGLLNQKAATTHWYYFEQFAEKYPQVNLQRHHFITQSGKLFCSGSINAQIDLTLYFIENYFGKAVSHVIEQHFNHEINRTYDKPWFASGASRHPDEGIIEVQQWMQSHVSQKFNLNALAELANMSVRNFSRRFKAAVGKSALAYGLELKMQMARELLKQSNLTHQDIADQLGFRDVAYFARQFKSKNDLTPSAYRQMVRGKLFETSKVS
jgi:transcriptional regulator GlxA family with amidase domain